VFRILNKPTAKLIEMPQIAINFEYEFSCNYAVGHQIRPEHLTKIDAIE